MPYLNWHRGVSGMGTGGQSQSEVGNDMLLAALEKDSSSFPRACQDATAFRARGLTTTGSLRQDKTWKRTEHKAGGKKGTLTASFQAQIKPHLNPFCLSQSVSWSLISRLSQFHGFIPSPAWSQLPCLQCQVPSLAP